jgi:hypothetical protein
MRTEYSTPRHTLTHSRSSIATSWLLRRCPTLNGIRCHGDVLSFRGNTLFLSLTVRCSVNVLTFRCPGDGLQYSRFQAWFTESLPSDGRLCLWCIRKPLRRERQSVTICYKNVVAYLDIVPSLSTHISGCLFERVLR